MIDANTGALIASIPVAEDPDSAIYDPHTRTVVVIGGDSGVVTLIDPRSATKSAEIKVGGKLEFGVVDGRGRLWINDEEKHEIVAVDLDAKSVLAHYPLTGLPAPDGSGVRGWESARVFLSGRGKDHRRPGRTRYRHSAHRRRPRRGHL